MDADAKQHQELAEVYRWNPNTLYPKGGGPGIFRTAEHCDSAAKSLWEAAKSLRACRRAGANGQRGLKWTVLSKARFNDDGEKESGPRATAENLSAGATIRSVCHLGEDANPFCGSDNGTGIATGM